MEVLSLFLFYEIKYQFFCSFIGYIYIFFLLLEAYKILGHIKLAPLLSLYAHIHRKKIRIMLGPLLGIEIYSCEFIHTI